MGVDVAGAGSGAVHRQRLASQLLSHPEARSVPDVAAHLLAVQAQDPRGARLAVRARSTGVSASDLDRALATERSVVVSWLNRGTLHLVTAEDYWWLRDLTCPPRRAWNVRRLADEGVSPAQAERGVSEVVEAAKDGPVGRPALRERLANAGVPVAGQAFAHVLIEATLRGHVIRAAPVGGDQAFALVGDWLGPAPRTPDRDVALAELARRYLAGHGPADHRDLARWAGIGLRDARRALQGVRGIVERPDGLVDLPRDGGLPDPPPPRLLGSFDPLLLGWRSRDDVVGEHRSLVTINGIFRPFALVGGRAVAVWRLSGGVVDIEPLEPVAGKDLGALQADAADVLRFLDR